MLLVHLQPLTAWLAVGVEAGFHRLAFGIAYENLARHP